MEELYGAGFSEFHWFSSETPGVGSAPPGTAQKPVPGAPGALGAAVEWDDKGDTILEGGDWGAVEDGDALGGDSWIGAAW